MATEIKSARDALESISAWAEANLRDYGDDWRLHNRLCDMLKSALALPRRNCDVGTAEEQLTRFNEFCQSRYDPEDFDGVIPTGCKCPCQRPDGCNQFVWAQMPYEADAQKGGAE